MTSPRCLAFVFAFLVATAACGRAQRYADAGEDDAAAYDAGTVAEEDAMPPPPAPPAPGREVSAGAGRLRGQVYVLDVQVGHAVEQRPSAGAAVSVEGNAPVKP